MHFVDVWTFEVLGFLEITIKSLVPYTWGWDWYGQTQNLHIRTTEMLLHLVQNSRQWFIIPIDLPLFLVFNFVSKLLLGFRVLFEFMCRLFYTQSAHTFHMALPFQCGLCVFTYYVVIVAGMKISKQIELKCKCVTHFVAFHSSHFRTSTTVGYFRPIAFLCFYFFFLPFFVLRLFRFTYK